MTTSDTERPTDVPDELIAALEGSSDSQLREIIHYAQQLLREHPPLTDAIESRNGEELVRLTDHDGYSIVIVERPEEPVEARGPFAYRVNWMPSMSEGEGQYRWHYLGRVHGDIGWRERD